MLVLRGSFQKKKKVSKLSLNLCFTSDLHHLQDHFSNFLLNFSSLAKNVKERFEGKKEIALQNMQLHKIPSPTYSPSPYIVVPQGITLCPYLCTLIKYTALLSVTFTVKNTHSILSSQKMFYTFINKAPHNDFTLQCKQIRGITENKLHMHLRSFYMSSLSAS